MNGAAVDQLRFGTGLGTYAVSVAPDSVFISRGMGAHCLLAQLEVAIPPVGAAAGRLLCLEATLYAQQAIGPRAPLGSANVSVPFNPTGEARRPTLQFLVTNAQLLALEQQRAGDLPSTDAADRGLYDEGPQHSLDRPNQITGNVLVLTSTANPRLSTTRR